MRFDSSVYNIKNSTIVHIFHPPLYAFQRLVVVGLLLLLATAWARPEGNDVSQSVSEDSQSQDASHSADPGIDDENELQEGR